MINEIENIISHIQPEEDSEKIKDYVYELEQQKAELTQLLKEIDENVSTEWFYEYLHYKNRIAEIINK